MARETRAAWARRVERWQRSGLTADRFAEQEGLNARTPAYWKWRRRLRARHAGGAARRARGAAMIPSQVRTFVCAEPIDMRRSFDGLARAARERLGKDPREGGLFVFANKREKQVTFDIPIAECVRSSRRDAHTFIEKGHRRRPSIGRDGWPGRGRRLASCHDDPHGPRREVAPARGCLVLPIGQRGGRAVAGRPPPRFLHRDSC